MSDIFDDDPMYIQQGGILSVGDIKKMFSAWNNYIKTLHITTGVVTQDIVDKVVPENFHWRRVITKTAGGVDDVAVQFISKRDPAFSYTTPPIRAKSKRQRAFQLASGVRPDRRRTGLEYLRHLKMTQPTFLRTSPRDIATQQTQAVFTAVYGEEEMGRVEHEHPEVRQPITHISVAPREVQAPVVRQDPQAPVVRQDPQAPAVQMESIKGVIPPDVLKHHAVVENVLKIGGALYTGIVVGSLNGFKSKDPRFLNQHYYWIAGAEEFGGIIFNSKKKALAHKYRVMGGKDSPRGNILKEAERIKKDSINARVRWSQDSRSGLKIPQFLALGGIVGMFLKHMGRFTDADLEHLDQTEGEWGGEEGIQYPENITEKWHISRWVAEFLDMDYGKQMEYFRYYENKLFLYMYPDTEDEWNEQIWNGSIYAYLDFLGKNDEQIEEHYEFNKSVLEKVEDYLGQVGLVGKAIKVLGLADSARLDYSNVKQSVNTLPIPFDMNNWFKAGFLINPDEEHSLPIIEDKLKFKLGGEIETAKSYPKTLVPNITKMRELDYREGQTYNIRIEPIDMGIKTNDNCLEMYSIRGLNPNFIFREPEQAVQFFYHYGGDFEGTSRIITERTTFRKIRPSQRKLRAIKQQQRPDPINWECARFFTNLEYLYADTGDEDIPVRSDFEEENYQIALRLLSGVNANIEYKESRGKAFLEQTKHDSDNGFRVGKRQFKRVHYKQTQFYLPPDEDTLEGIEQRQIEIYGEVGRVSVSKKRILHKGSLQQAARGSQQIGSGERMYIRQARKKMKTRNKLINLSYRIVMRPVIVRNQYYKLTPKEMDKVKLSPHGYSGWEERREAEIRRATRERPNLHPEDRQMLEEWEEDITDVSDWEKQTTSTIMRQGEELLAERIKIYRESEEYLIWEAEEKRIMEERRAKRRKAYSTASKQKASGKISAKELKARKKRDEEHALEMGERKLRRREKMLKKREKREDKEFAEAWRRAAANQRKGAEF